jgi:hypothetical protein
MRHTWEDGREENCIQDLGGETGQNKTVWKTSPGLYDIITVDCKELGRVAVY